MISQHCPTAAYGSPLKAVTTSAQIEGTNLQRTCNSLAHRTGTACPGRRRRVSNRVGVQASMEHTAEERKQIALEMYEGYKKHFPSVPEISPAALVELLKERDSDSTKVVVVDARGADEQEISMIPDGTLKQADFEKRKADYKDHQVVAYCTIGYRSGKYAERLRKEGFDASNLLGSILMWTHGGYPLVSSYDEERGSAPSSDASSRTPRVHTFGKKWRLAGDGYEMVTPEPEGFIAKVKAAVIERFA